MNGQCQFYILNDAAETHDSNPENYYLANSFVDNELPDNFCRALLPFEAIFSVNHADIVDIISFMFSRMLSSTLFKIAAYWKLRHSLSPSSGFRLERLAETVKQW